MESRKKQIWIENGLNPNNYSLAVGEAMQQYANELVESEFLKFNKYDSGDSVCQHEFKERNERRICNKCKLEIGMPL